MGSSPTPRIKFLVIYIYNFDQENSNIDGLTVTLVYRLHVEDKKSLDPKIFEYNEDDVRAIPFLIEKTALKSKSYLKTIPINTVSIKNLPLSINTSNNYK